MRIDKRLNLVVPVDTDRGTLYVHSTPIAAEVFEQNFLLVSKTFSAIYGHGLGPRAGPRVSSMLMARIAENGDELESHAALMAEIRRLSNVLVPGPGGWETVPLQEAVDKGSMERIDASEVENAIVFFTVCSAMHRRSELPEILDGAAKLWGAQTTPLNCTGFAASLQTSTEEGSSGEKAEESLVPH